LKALLEQIKESRRAENLSAGPQSKLLEGVTWQEADRLQVRCGRAGGEEKPVARVQDAELSGAAAQERVLIGAASQGIIEREFRHNAQIYRQLYQPNPFVSATDEDIHNYVEHVRRHHAAAAPTEPQRHAAEHGESHPAAHLTWSFPSDGGTESPGECSALSTLTRRESDDV